MTDRAVGYTRLSQDGKSLPEQRQQIEDYCDDRSLEVVEVYSDGEHASGYTTKRSQYQALLDRLDEDDVGHVVVRGLSRLSRDRLHRVQLLIELHREDVDVHAVERGDSNPVDLSEPWALTREAGQADADDHEKRKEADRGRAEAERRERLGLPNGPAPTGLQYDEDKERLIPADQFGDVLEVLRLRAESGRSWREIAAETGFNKDTARRAYERRKQYLDAGDRRRDELDEDDRELLDDLVDQLAESADRL